MSEPFLAEIRIFGFNFAPKGWALTNGQLLPINQNQALFAILGTTYGGNGVQTFALPNLQGTTPIHAGNTFVFGQVGGESSISLNVNQMPGHTHIVTASTAAADQSTPVNNLWAQGNNAYTSAPNGAMNAIATTGGGQPHINTPPYVVLNFAIALQGIFPTRN